MCVEYGRLPELEDVAAEWLAGVEADVVTTRAAELPVATSQGE